MWQSELAAEWHPVLDYEAVHRLGNLYANLEDEAPNAALLAQIARLEGELGLSPAARKKLYVRVAEVENRPKPERIDPRQRMRAVESELEGIPRASEP